MSRKRATPDATMERMREAYYESVHLRVLGTKKRKRPGVSASKLRDELLKKLGPVHNCMYDPAALTLLTEFELALREEWARIEACEVRRLAEQAIADVLGIPAQFRMPA